MKYKGSLGVVSYLVAMIFIFLLNVQALDLEYQIIIPIRSPEPQENANFGQTLAISEEILVIGEPNADVEEIQNAGRAYIFDVDGNSLKTLQSPKPELHVYFGRTVAVSNDIILIGEPIANELDDVDIGRAYVFDYDGNLLKTLRAPEPQEYGNFGWSVAVGEDVLVVGEPGADTEGMFSAGRAYIFDYDGNLLKTLQAQEPQAYSKFGYSVAINNDILIIGECYARLESMNEIGRAYVFDYDGNLLKTLRAPEPQEYGNFGWSVAVGEDVLVVGEPGADTEGMFSAGRAYIFDYDGNLLKTLQAQEPQEGAEFGKSITISMEDIFVGEPSATVEGIYSAGKVTVFDHDGNVLVIIQPPNPQYGGAFGTSLSVSEDRVAIGEEKADVGGIIFAGKTHIIQLIKEDRATFILSNLTINPISVEVGEIVTIQIEVTNRGGQDGTYNVTLKINNIIEDKNTVFLNPNETEIVNFEILTAQPGTYFVKVNNLSDSYSVTEPTKDNNPFRDISGFPLESIAIGLIGAVIMFWFLFYKKR